MVRAFGRKDEVPRVVPADPVSIATCNDPRNPATSNPPLSPP